MNAALAVTMRAAGVGGGDAERRRLEDARQPHLGVGVRLGAGRLLAAVEHEHGDDAPGPMAAADELGRERAAVLAQQIELEPRRAALGAARHGADQVGAVGRHDVEQRQRAAGLGAQAQPLRERRIDVGDAPVRSHGEQPLGKTVVEGQRRFQPAHRLDLARALAGDVGHLPQRQPLSLQAGARRREEGPHADPQPAAAAIRRRDASGRRTPRRGPRRARPRD